jgi:putative cell wall-binding protein
MVLAASVVVSGATPAGAGGSGADGGDGVSGAEQVPSPSARSSAGVLGSPPEVSGATVGQVVPVDRFAGADRVATSIALAELAWGGRAPTVLLASSRAYPDALSASGLSGVLDAPVVLTSPEALSGSVGEALGRWGTQRVVIVGGPAAVSDEVMVDLDGRGIEVSRESGPDRFATAAAVADLVVASSLGSDHVYVVEGLHADPRRGWPDAVAVSAVAARNRSPVLLTVQDRVPEATAEALASIGPSAVTVVGGPQAVSDQVVAELGGFGPVSRVWGLDRYETSSGVVAHGRGRGVSSMWTMVVTGGNWPDALSAGSAAGRLGGAVLLVAPDRLEDQMPLAGMIRADEVAWVGIAGGAAAISQAVQDRLVELVGPPAGSAVPHPSDVEVVSGRPLEAMTVRVRAGAQSGLQVGGILAAGPGPSAPDGVFGRVVSIGAADASGWATVGLSATSLDQVLPAAALSVRAPGLARLEVGEGPVRSSSRAAQATEPGGLLLACGRSGVALSATVTPDVSADLSVDLSYDLDDPSLRISPSLTVGARANVELTADGVISCSKKLGELKFESLPTFVFPTPLGFPITVTPTLGGDVKAAVTVSGSATVAADGGGQLTLNPTYDLADGFSDSSSVSTSGTITTLSLDGTTGKLELTMTGTAGFLLWKIAGAKISTTLGTDVTHDGCRDPLGKFDVFNTLGVGIQFNSLLSKLLQQLNLTSLTPSASWDLARNTVHTAGTPGPSTCSTANAFRPHHLPAGEVDEAYQQQLTVRSPDGSTPTHPDVTFALTGGTLPAGLTLQPDGQLTGTPTTVEDQHVTVTATITHPDSTQTVRRHAYHLLVVDQSLQVTTDQIDPFPLNTPGTFQLDTDTDRAVLWHHESGALPDGLTLEPDGQLTGTPTEAGAYPIVISAHFADGTNHASDTATFSITVIDEIPPCDHPDPPRDHTTVIFDNVGSGLVVTDPESGAAATLDAAGKLQIHRDGNTTTLTGGAPQAISPGGQWLLSGIPGQGQELIDLGTSARTSLPGDALVYWRDVGRQGRVVGFRLLPDGPPHAEAIMVDRGGGIQVLPTPPPAADFVVASTRAEHVLGDGSVVGHARHDNETQDGPPEMWFVLRWPASGGSPTVVDQPDETAVIAAAGTEPWFQWWVPGGGNMLHAPTGSIVAIPTHVDGTALYPSAAQLLDSGVQLRTSYQSTPYDLYLITPAGQATEVTPTLAAGETISTVTGHGITDEGILYVTVGKNGNRTTIRCVIVS